MKRKDYWVGLDAGHHETAVCLIGKHGDVLFEAMRESHPNAIRDILRLFGVEHVRGITIEAGVGTHIALALLDRGFPVQVVDVRKSSKFLAIRRHKTDASDARGLAELGRFGTSVNAGIFVKPREHQDIRTRLNIRKNLLVNQIRTDSMIRSIMRLHGANLPVTNRRGSVEKEVRNQLESLDKEGVQLRVDLAPLVETAEAHRRHVAKLDKELRLEAQTIPTCALLQTMHGVGHITALSFYSTICDPWRFKRDKDVGAYLGLTPTLRQSGATARRGRVGRFGNKMTRANLTMAAIVLLTQSHHESKLKTWGLGLVERAGFTTARVAVARKMAVILLRMWKSGKAFEADYDTSRLLPPREEAGLDPGALSGNSIPL